jgi:hypothetical protein
LVSWVRAWCSSRGERLWHEKSRVTSIPLTHPGGHFLNLSKKIRTVAEPRILATPAAILTSNYPFKKFG